PHASLRARRIIQSELVTIRYTLVYQGATSRLDSQPAPPPGRASPSRSTIRRTAGGSAAPRRTATAAPSEWPTTTGRARCTRAARPPPPIRKRCPVDAHERARVELRRRDVPARGGNVVRERRSRQDEKHRGDRDPDPPQPTLHARTAGHDRKRTRAPNAAFRS